MQGSIDGQGPLQALIFTDDPLLAPQRAPNGTVKWLQIVGLHPDELDAVQSWNAKHFIELLRESDPLLLTHSSRPSLMSDASMSARVREGIEQDGSSFALRLGGSLRWRPATALSIEVSVDRRAADELRDGVARRVARGRIFACVGEAAAPGTALVVTPAEGNRWLIDQNGALVIQLTPDFAVRVHDGLRQSGTLEWPELRGIRFLVK
jgi:hypothetical protein